MPSVLKVGFVFLLGAAAAGCAAHPAPQLRVREPGFYVPTAAIVQMRGRETATSAYQMLPTSDGEYYIARAEKTVWGDIPVYESTSYSVETYDVQTIANRGTGNGYRYRWGLQQGLSYR